MYNNVKSIRVKRGIKKDLPTRLPSGEPAFCVDTNELYIGMGDNEEPSLVGTNFSNSTIIINGVEQNVEELFKDLVSKVTTLETKVTTLETNLNAFINSKGKPNGIAPLDSQGLVPVKNLPQAKQQVIYSSPNTNTSSSVFQLTGIDLTKYHKVTISHSAPHSCTSTFYVNGQKVTDISTTSLVEFIIENGRVTSNINLNGSSTVTMLANSTFKWQYISGCAEPYYYNMRIVGYYY